MEFLGSTGMFIKNDLGNVDSLLPNVYAVTDNANIFYYEDLLHKFKAQPFEFL